MSLCNNLINDLHVRKIFHIHHIYTTTINSIHQKISVLTESCFHAAALTLCSKCEYDRELSQLVVDLFQGLQQSFPVQTFLIYICPEFHHVWFRLRYNSRLIVHIIIRRCHKRHTYLGHSLTYCHILHIYDLHHCLPL